MDKVHNECDEYEKSLNWDREFILKNITNCDTDNFNKIINILSKSEEEKFWILTELISSFIMPIYDRIGYYRNIDYLCLNMHGINDALDLIIHCKTYNDMIYNSKITDYTDCFESDANKIILLIEKFVYIKQDKLLKYTKLHESLVDITLKKYKC